MKKFAVILILALAFAGVSGSAQAMQYYVWQDIDGDNLKDVVIGTITAYSGGLTGAANYALTSASGHPVNGPTPTPFESKLWLYDGSDGLSLGIIHNLDNPPGGGNENYWNHVRWDMNVTGTTSSVLLDDDATPENRGEVGMVQTGTHYDLGWAYIDNSDGGVIGTFQGDDWEIMIDPELFGDIQSWDIYSGDGGSVNLWQNPMAPPNPSLTGDYYARTNAYTTFITAAPVPEPGTLFLLGTGLAGLGAAYRRRRK